MPVRPALLGGASLLALAGVAHALPATTTLPVVRRRFPVLEGWGEQGHVALTFDDGPDPESTPAFLDELDRLGVRATFFLLGCMLERAPDLGQELVRRGHEAAVHGWDHRSTLRSAPRATWSQFARARDLVTETTGHRPRFFRPPFGILSTATLVGAGKVGMQPVLWGVWGRDWEARATPARVLRTLRGRSGVVPGGATVLLHDSDCTSDAGAWRSALGVLEPLVEHCRARGLDVGPLREHGLPYSGR